MREHYTEKPPVGTFEELNGVGDLHDLNELAKIYSFQLNCLASDATGATSLPEAEMHGYVSWCITQLNDYAQRLNIVGEQVEITGNGTHRSPELNAPLGSTSESYDCFTGTYLGFKGQHVTDNMTRLERWVLGHTIELARREHDEIIYKRSEEFLVFVAAEDVELAETPIVRQQRELAELVLAVDPNDDLLQEIEAVLFAGNELINIAELGLIFDNVDISAIPQPILDMYLSYLNLQTEIVNKSLLIDAAYYYVPRDNIIMHTQSGANLTGLSQGFCFSEGLMFETIGGNTSSKKQLFIALQNGSDNEVILVPASAVDDYLFDDVRPIAL